jgi:hypothetical protein
MLRHLWFSVCSLANPALCSLAVGPGGLRCVRGTPPARWLADCADACRELGVERGRIDVVGRDGRLRLRFSPDLPRCVHQRLRNVFGVHHLLLRSRRR